MGAAAIIGIGAFFGAWLRYLMGILLNSIFPTIPLGTLSANLLGSFLMGAMIFLSVEHTFFSYEARIGIITGFLGSLTTFSTFSAEAFALISKQEFLWLTVLLLAHVLGSIFSTFAGYVVAKYMLTFEVQ